MLLHLELADTNIGISRVKWKSILVSSENNFSKEQKLNKISASVLFIYRMEGNILIIMK